MIDTYTQSDRWTKWHLLAAVGMGVLGVLATWSAWSDMYHISANDEENSHVFLVPIVIAWLIWVRRSRFRYTRPVGLLIGPLIAVTGWIISSYGFHNGVQSFFHGGAVMVVVGCILSVLGRQVFFRFMPAFVVLAFLIPVPGRVRVQIAQPLQERTSLIAAEIMQVTGSDVERSGNLLTVNGTPVNIVEACNGLRGVFGLFLISYAFSFGLPLRNWVRIMVLALSPVAAIFCNVVRIVPTVWIYGRYPSHVGDIFHEYSGWLMLPIAFLILLGIIRVLRWAMIPVMRYTLASQTA
jgi:exosortase